MKSEKQRFFHRDTGWEERAPSEISVEAFTTGNISGSREENLLQDNLFPSHPPDPYHLPSTASKLK
jgi:hypothetical protein